MDLNTISEYLLSNTKLFPDLSFYICPCHARMLIQCSTWQGVNVDSVNFCIWCTLYRMNFSHLLSVSKVLSVVFKTLEIEGTSKQFRWHIGTDILLLRDCAKNSWHKTVKLWDWSRCNNENNETRREETKSLTSPESGNVNFDTFGHQFRPT